MAQNEKTSKSVATIASEIMQMDKPFLMTDALWKDIKSLAGSALTQTEDKPKTPIAEAYKKLQASKKVQINKPFNITERIIEELNKKKN